MYYILTTKYANAPVFCIKEPALRVLEALAKVEEYYILHLRDDHAFATILEILEFMKKVDHSIFEDFWFDIYSGDIAESEEPVEAAFTTEDVISAWGSIKLYDSCIYEIFPWIETYPEPEAKSVAKTPSLWKRLFL